MNFAKHLRLICLVALCVVFTAGMALAKTRVAVVFPATIDDVSWNQAMYESLKRMEAKMGADNIEIAISERLNNPVDAAAAVRQYASQGYDIIFAHGTQYLSLLNDIAPDFPEITFAYGTGFATPHPNIFAYDVNAEEGGYLMGIIGSEMSKSGILGVVAPIDAGSPAKFVKGFTQGAKATKPAVDVRVAFTGSFSDMVGAGEIARAHLKAGSDFLLATSQQAVGALKAASETPGVLYICSDLNPKDMAPKTVLGAMVYDFELVAEAILKNRAAGKIGGEFMPLTLANGGLRMEFNLPVPKAIMDKADAAKADIISGKLKVNIQQK